MEQEMTIDLKDLFEIIKKRIVLIISVTLVFTIISGIISFFVLKSTYEAKVSIIVGKSPTITQNDSLQYNDVMMYQKIIKTYGEIAKSRSVAEKVKSRLNSDLSAEAIQSSVTVSPQNDTQIIYIKAQCQDKVEAARLANTFSDVFIDEANKVYPAANIQIIDSAIVPENPIKPRKALNVAIAFVLGLMVSLGIVFLKEFMDNTIKTEDDIEKYLGLPVIGTIPKNMD